MTARAYRARVDKAEVTRAGITRPPTKGSCPLNSGTVADRQAESVGNFLLTSGNSADNGCRRTRVGDNPPGAARPSGYRPDVFPRLRRRVYPLPRSHGSPGHRTTSVARNYQRHLTIPRLRTHGNTLTFLGYSFGSEITRAYIDVNARPRNARDHPPRRRSFELH